MNKLEICKKLSRLGWMSQAVIDHKVSRVDCVDEGFLYRLYSGSYVHDIIMGRINWGEIAPLRTWSVAYEQYVTLGTCIRDIE